MIGGNRYKRGLKLQANGIRKGELGDISAGERTGPYLSSRGDGDSKGGLKKNLSSSVEAREISPKLKMRRGNLRKRGRVFRRKGKHSCLCGGRHPLDRIKKGANVVLLGMTAGSSP